MNNKKLTLGLLLVLVVAVIGLYLPKRSTFLRGTTNYDQLDTADGYSVDGTTIINGSGALTGAASSTSNANFGSFQIGGGTQLLEHGCATSSWNPGSIGTSSLNAAATSTNILLSGAAVGDACIGSLSSATTSLAVTRCEITANATATLNLMNFTSGALDLATGTARVCYFAY